MTRSEPCRPSPPEPCAGFAVIGLLLLISVVAMFGATYLRHVHSEDRHSDASRHVLDAGDAVTSAVAYTEQRLRLGDFDLTASIDNGSATASVTASDLGDDRAGVWLQSVDADGIGVTLLAEAALVPSLASARAPDDLPRVDAATLDAILNDPTVTKTYISGSQTVTGRDLAGLVILEDASTLTLDGVTVRGAIVSETLLTAQPLGPYDSLTAPALVVGGDVRLEPAAFLPGVAVVVPDGRVTSTSGPTSLQCDGDLVAHEVTLLGLGALRGQLATAMPPNLAAGVLQPGRDRGPRAWGDGLDDIRHWDAGFLAFLPRHDTVQDLPGVTGFSFP